MKNYNRRWMRICSMMLVLILLGNDCIGNAGTVFGAQLDQGIEDSLTGDESFNENNVGGTDDVENTEREPSADPGTSEVTSDSSRLTDDTDIQEDLLDGSEEDTALDAETEEPEEEISEFLLDDEEQTVLIAEEDISQRSSNIKHFKKRDNTFIAAVYPDPVHYQENGEWKEIDNRLADAREEDNTPFWGNQANQLDVKFAKKSNGNKLVKLKLEDFQISWGLKDAQKVDAVQKDTVSERLEPGTEHHDEPSKDESGETDISSEDPKENGDNGEDGETLDEETENADLQDSEVDESSLSEPASLLTENPEAAQSGLSLEDAEEEYGAKIKNLPENNTTEGILPEDREDWNTTNDPGEESMDASYFASAEEYNREMMAVENLYSAVAYGDILPGVDLEYILESQRVKENIILKDASAPNSFVFQYQSHGMEPVQDGNRILFQDGEGKVVFEIDAPFVYDASGEFSTEVSVELTKGNGKKCEVTVTVDEAWLTQEGRAFPVVVDPAIRTDQDATAILDTYVMSTSPSTNFYNRSILKTGVDSSGGVARSYMRFNLPDLKPGDMVIDAKLILYCLSSGNAQRTVMAHKINDTTWTSTGVTWQTMPDTENTAEDYVVFTTSAGSPVSFDITTLAQEWLREGECSGVMIKAAKEDGEYTEYVSSDYSSAYKDCRPCVLFCYINNTGLEEYWTYHEQSIGRAGTGYVNDYNGNMVMVHDTVSTTGNLMPASLTHVYNTNDQGTNIGYGNGWRLNYHQTIREQTITGVKYYIYTDEDGTLHYFLYDDDKKQWVDESGLDLKLTVATGSTYAFTITDKSDNKLLFNSGGSLVRMEDQNGNALTITYTSGKISSIKDGAGRTVTLSYNSSGLLSTVKDPYGKTKTFTYSGNNLTQIKDTDSKLIKYTYDSNGMMNTAQDIDGYTIQYTYSTVSPHRVEQVEEKSGSTAGQMFSILRWNNQTTFTDRDGRKETYLFNNAGNTITVRNDKGQAQSSKYLTGGSNSNKISKVSKLQTSAVNLLQNSYLESDSGWSRIQEEASVTLHADAAKALVGTNTFHMVSAKDAGKGGCQQSVTLEKGKTYTFSAYVNAPSSVLEQGKCEVQIQAVLSSGDTLCSQDVDYYKTEDGWYRLIATLAIPGTATVSSGNIYAGIRGKADVYFDCFQFEEGKAASRYNLITNGDFRNGINGYTGSGTNLYDRARKLSDIYGGLQVTYRRGTVTGDSVNLRTGPGTGNSAVTTVSKNTEITIIGDALDSGGTAWYYTYVVKSGQVYSGYIISSYVSIGTSKRTADKAVVDASNMNVRKGPGKGYTSLTTVSRNETLYIVDVAVSSAGQQWVLAYFEKSGTKYIGYILDEYIYQEWLETCYSGLETEYLDDNVYHMTGNPSFVKKLTQTLLISGKKGDTYTGNLWGCGDPASAKDNRTFGLEVEFILNDGTSETYTSNFKASGNDWQFLHDVFVAKHPYKKIN
ncbi:MAG: DNRLRE domain-containing protein, partial [Eubacterium sp.]|nr:DNRLRE domain-containing protein [Eubacterium sp.]